MSWHEIRCIKRVTQSMEWPVNGVEMGLSSSKNHLLCDIASQWNANLNENNSK